MKISNISINFPILSRLIRLVYPFGAVRKVLIGRIKGFKYHVEPSMGFSYAFGGSAFNLNFFSSKIKEGDVIYDIGANRGQCSLLFAKLVGHTGKVLSFEPVKEVFDILSLNIDLNNLKNVLLFNSAAADFEGSASFHYSPESSTQGHLTEVRAQLTDSLENNNETLEVSCLTLDRIFLETSLSPTLVKIDVEGGAESVLNGMLKILKECKPNIYIEIHNDKELLAAKRILESYHYKFFNLDGLEITPTSGFHPTMWCQCKTRSSHS